jgi:hypothetical protein
MVKKIEESLSKESGEERIVQKSVEQRSEKKVKNDKESMKKG